MPVTSRTKMDSAQPRLRQSKVLPRAVRYPRAYEQALVHGMSGIPPSVEEPVLGRSR